MQGNLPRASSRRLMTSRSWSTRVKKMIRKAGGADAQERGGGGEGGGGGVALLAQFASSFRAFSVPEAKKERGEGGGRVEN